MDLNILKKFLLEDNLFSFILKDTENRNLFDLTFSYSFHSNKIFLYVKYIFSCNGKWLSIISLYKNNCLKLPLVIINLLSSESSIKHTLALNLIKQLNL